MGGRLIPSRKGKNGRRHVASGFFLPCVKWRGTYFPIPFCCVLVIRCSSSNYRSLCCSPENIHSAGVTNYNRQAANDCLLAVCLVGRLGFEPGMTEPKPVVLPLHHRPIIGVGKSDIFQKSAAKVLLFCEITKYLAFFSQFPKKKVKKWLRPRTTRAAPAGNVAPGRPADAAGSRSR